MSVAGPSTKFDCSLKKWNHYILASESSQSSSEGSETAYSVQGKETDVARDTSDLSSDECDTTLIEYEVQSDDGTDKDLINFADSNGSTTDDEIIKTTVIKAIVPEGDFLFADSEDSYSSSIDPEFSKFDYWKCVRCHNQNNNPMFRYCEKCYQLRKDFFPPPPKHKKRRTRKRTKRPKQSHENTKFTAAAGSSVFHSAEGIGFHLSSTISNHITNNAHSGSEDTPTVNSSQGLKRKYQSSSSEEEEEHSAHHQVRKRFRSFLAESVDLITKLGDIKDSVDSFSQPVFSTFDDISLQKSFSEPTVKFSKDDLDLDAEKIHASEKSDCSSSKSEPLIKMVDKSVSIDAKERSDLCITCLVEPKSGVFVHGRIAHICCCYKCSVKVWAKTKRCPICKCKVSNVLKAFVS